MAWNKFSMIIGLLLVSSVIGCQAQGVYASARFKAEGITSLAPSEIFSNPEYLNSAWLQHPIPLSFYTQQEIAGQKSINTEVAEAIITFSPAEQQPEWLNIDYEEITPYTWKWIYLTLLNKDSTITEMSLRRPNWWIKRYGVDSVGKVIFIDLDEIDAHGWASVKKIYPNQLDTRVWGNQRNGQYVNMPIIGKFVHESETVLDLYFDNSEPLGVTSNHPIWSNDRNEWVEAAALSIQECVTTYTGKSRLVRKEKRLGKHKVYNIEVYRSHNYFVSAEAILVHNAPCTWESLREAQPHGLWIGDNLIAYSTGIDEYGVRLYFIAKAQKFVNGKLSDRNADLKSIIEALKHIVYKEDDIMIRVRINAGEGSGFSIKGIKNFGNSRPNQYGLYIDKIDEENGVVDFLGLSGLFIKE